MHTPLLVKVKGGFLSTWSSPLGTKHVTVPYHNHYAVGERIPGKLGIRYDEIIPEANLYYLTNQICR